MCVRAKSFTHTIRGALFTTVKNWKQLKCPSPGEQIKQKGPTKQNVTRRQVRMNFSPRENTKESLRRFAW